MLTVGLVLAGLAAALHVYIFYMESLAWTKPSTRAVFGTSAEEAESSKELAFNQGFYNLFLAVVTGVGIALTAATATTPAGHWCWPAPARWPRRRPCWCSGTRPTCPRPSSRG